MTKILITGGASGLGAAITGRIAEKFPDAEICFTYNTSAEKAKAIEKEFSNCRAIQCDFKNREHIDALCDFIKNNNTDILINNAVTGIDKNHFHKTPQEYFSASFAANVIPVLSITQAFITNARKRKSGKIITVLSAAVHNSPPIGWSVYIAEKNYLLAMHRSWATENAAFNITSNCVSPGFMNTPLNADTDERIKEDMAATHPLKKLLTPEDVAATVVFLAGAGNQLNMQNIIINSSLTVH